MPHALRGPDARAAFPERPRRGGAAFARAARARPGRVARRRGGSAQQRLLGGRVVPPEERGRGRLVGEAGLREPALAVGAHDRRDRALVRAGPLEAHRVDPHEAHGAAERLGEGRDVPRHDGTHADHGTRTDHPALVDRRAHAEVRARAHADVPGERRARRDGRAVADHDALPRGRVPARAVRGAADLRRRADHDPGAEPVPVADPQRPEQDDVRTDDVALAELDAGTDDGTGVDRVHHSPESGRHSTHGCARRSGPSRETAARPLVPSACQGNVDTEGSPMIPISSVDLGPEVEAEVLKVLRSGMVAQGPVVAEFERRFAELSGVKHAVAVNNGTTALVASLQVLDLEPGDEVITSPFTFVATLNAILEAGATATFADIDDADFNLSAAATAAAVTDRTKVLMPVHLYGQTADAPAF